MKASNYNFFYEKDDEYLAYNSRSNALAVITKSVFEKYRWFKRKSYNYCHYSWHRISEQVKFKCVLYRGKGLNEKEFYYIYNNIGYRNWMLLSL